MWKWLTKEVLGFHSFTIVTRGECFPSSTGCLGKNGSSSQEHASNDEKSYSHSLISIWGINKAQEYKLI